MALPRFHRLVADERARILDIAAERLADPATAGGSVVEIAAAAGLSRSAVYNYFDGRDDLIATVREHAIALATTALGAWPAADDVAGFWVALHEGSARLRALLRDRPDLRAVLAGAEAPSDDPWVSAVLDDAARLGLLVTDDPRLARAATAALLAAADGLELEGPGSVSDTRLEAMLTAVWSSLG